MEKGDERGDIREMIEGRGERGEKGDEREGEKER